MNSRARFSLAPLTVFFSPSSHNSMAGSTSMAWANAVNPPRPSRRRVSFWAPISVADRTLVAEVAKWLCQQNVSFSSNG